METVPSRGHSFYCGAPDAGLSSPSAVNPGVFGEIVADPGGRRGGSPGIYDQMRRWLDKYNYKVNEYFTLKISK